MNVAAMPPPMPPPATKTVRVMIKGRVQGVFFWDWTVENARQLGLKGWVRNRRDGSVEALFSGEPAALRCRYRPQLSPPKRIPTKALSASRHLTREE